MTPRSAGFRSLPLRHRGPPADRASAAGSSRSPSRDSRSPALGRLRRTDARRLAVEVARTLDLERELDGRQQRIEAGQAACSVVGSRPAGAVGREIAGRVDFDDEHALDRCERQSSGTGRRGDAVDASRWMSRMRSPPSMRTFAARERVRRERLAGSARSSMCCRCVDRVRGSSDTSRKSMPFSASDARATALRRAFVAAEISIMAATPSARELAPSAAAACGARCTATVTRSVGVVGSRPATASTWITSPSHCCSAPCTRNCVVGGQLVAVRREDQLQQPAAEVGPVDALAGRGEQHLLDHIADVIVVVGRRPCGRARRSGMGSRCS